jgi:NCS1 nucleoside transporter family
MVVSSFAIGALAGPVFFLGFVDALLTIFFINILGIMSVSFFSTFGPRFGLRQMVLSRFYFGYYGVKLIAFFNVLACIGWSSVNVIVGSQLINTVNSNVPGWAGIVIIAAATFFVTLFGYKVVHAYEYWSWIPCFIVFLLLLGEFAHSGAFYNIPMGVGQSETGGVLSFAASVFGFATGWTSYAADYTVYQPANTSRIRTFAWTFAGLIFPLCFTEMLGLAVSTAMFNDNFGVDWYAVSASPDTTTTTNPYINGYLSSGIGGLIGAVLIAPWGRFGEFCLVVLALSIIANNCPNIYSLSLSLQVMARWTAVVPRFLWTFIGTLVYCAIAIPGYSRFEQVLENFMLLIVSSHRPQANGSKAPN